jgi:membrane associated rhomboid family serine protease
MFFPLRDTIPSRSLPFVTISLIAVNTVVFIFELTMGQRALSGFVARNGLVPSHITYLLDNRPAFSATGFLPFFYSLFLHGGWFHLIGNMWFLWIFGDNVEDRLGHLKYLVFYLVCGLLGNVGHYLANPTSAMPAIGASGAIAGVLGAYVVSYPRARVLVLLFLFFFVQIVELPALLVLGLWFLLQFVNGTASLVASAETGGVAWWAHVGGFIGGIAIFYLFRPKRKYIYAG